MTFSSKLRAEGVRGVIFDHDGTLVDSETQHLRAWNQVLEEYGHFLPEEDYSRDYTGIPTIGSANKLVARFQLPLSPEQLTHRKQKNVQAFTDIPPLMPGAEQIILKLSEQQVPLAVATGARYLDVERNLRHHRLYDRFHAVCCCNHVANNKPAPDVYLLAAEKLGLHPAECIAVEDTPTGMQSALAAGMQCVVIPNLPSDVHDFSDATCVMPSLDTLLQWLLEKVLITEKL